MLTTIFAALLLLAAAVLFAAAPSFGGSRALGLLPAALATVALAFSCTTIIEAKNAGVVTTFGKPTASLEPGLHVKAPWQKVTELDGTWQTQKYEDDSKIPVRIGDGTTGHLSTTIRWRIVGSSADEIYAGYRSDDVNENVRDALVSTVFKAAVNGVMGKYNPTDDIRVVDPDADSFSVDFAPDYDTLAAEVTASMNDRVAEAGNLVEVQSITISGIELSEVTQKKINDFQAEVARTQVALQAKATASAQAAANRELSTSVSNDPNVLVSKCLDVIQYLAEERIKNVLPSGFSCWNGAGSALVVPSARR